METFSSQIATLAELAKQLNVKMVFSRSQSNWFLSQVDIPIYLTVVAFLSLFCAATSSYIQSLQLTASKPWGPPCHIIHIFNTLERPCKYNKIIIILLSALHSSNSLHTAILCHPSAHD